MANRRPVGGPKVTLERHLSKATASRRLARGWDYLVLIQSTEGFSTIFDGRGEPKAAVLNAAYSSAFAKRLEQLALLIGATLYVEIIGYKAVGLRGMAEFRLKDEAPAELVMQATYDEGSITRSLRQATA